MAQNEHLHEVTYRTTHDVRESMLRMSQLRPRDEEPTRTLHSVVDMLCNRLDHVYARLEKLECETCTRSRLAMPDVTSAAEAVAEAILTEWEEQNPCILGMSAEDNSFSAGYLARARADLVRLIAKRVNEATVFSVPYPGKLAREELLPIWLQAWKEIEGRHSETGMLPWSKFDSKNPPDVVLYAMRLAIEASGPEDVKAAAERTRRYNDLAARLRTAIGLLTEGDAARQRAALFLTDEAKR